MAAYDIWRTSHFIAIGLFLTAHALTIGIAAVQPQIRNDARLRSMLGASRKMVGLIHMGMFAILVTGIGLMTYGWWRMTWPWLALAVFVGMWVSMALIGTWHFDRLRSFFGDATFYKPSPRRSKPTAQEFERLRRSHKPYAAAAAGVTGFLLVFWLMVQKPF